jgi:hypothetical protein
MYLRMTVSLFPLVRGVPRPSSLLFDAKQMSG